MPAKNREPGVTTEDVAALVGSPETSPEAPARPPKLKLSEGIRDQLARLGTATDPNTGARWECDRDTGEVYVVDPATGKRGWRVDVPDPRDLGTGHLR